MRTRFRIFVYRIFGFFRKNSREQDLDDELAFHLQMETEEQLRSGVSPSRRATQTTCSPCSSRCRR